MRKYLGLIDYIPTGEKMSNPFTVFGMDPSTLINDPNFWYACIAIIVIAVVIGAVIKALGGK